MTATIDGQAFTADGVVTAGAQTSSGVATVTITGARAPSANPILFLSLWNVAGPGTYALGMNATNVGGIGSLTDGSSIWMTPFSGTAGTITISSMGSGRIAGTFSFTAAQSGNPSSTRNITNGAFNVPLTGTPGTVQPYQGSSMTATLGGTAWVGATIVTINKTGGVYSFGGTSTTGGGTAGISSVHITIGGVSGPGTFQVGPATANQLSIVFNNTPYNSGSAGSSGSVVVTSVDANRLKGTFSGSIAGLAVTNGTFDIGLGPP